MPLFLSLCLATCASIGLYYFQPVNRKHSTELSIKNKKEYINSDIEQLNSEGTL
jgi:hypothetical protein